MYLCKLLYSDSELATITTCFIDKEFLWIYREIQCLAQGHASRMNARH